MYMKGRIVGGIGGVDRIDRQNWEKRRKKTKKIGSDALQNGVKRRINTKNTEKWVCYPYACSHFYFPLIKKKEKKPVPLCANV